MSAILCGLAGAVETTVTLQATGSTNFRFKDIGGQAFSQAFINTFSYGSSNVNLTLTLQGSQLNVNVVGSGLKPNFAYQVKLVGRPSKNASNAEQLAAADDITNETLGRIGRWWRISPSPGNSNDADYNANKDDPNYIYEGYLLIGYFITGADGTIARTFEGNNSFHVLWRTDQRPQAPSDGPLTPVTVAATAGNVAYDVGLAARNYQLYGEHEPTRALPGQLELPLIDYRCNVVLTEESFHDFGALAGNWTSALFAPIDTTTVVVPATAPLVITGVRAKLMLARKQRENVKFNGTLQLPVGSAFENMVVDATSLGVLRSFKLNKRGWNTNKEGTIKLRAPKTGSADSRFQLQMKRASFSLTDSAAFFETPPVEADVTLSLVSGDQHYSGNVMAKVRTGRKTGTLKF